MDNNKKEFKPYIPADKVVPEFTVTALLIGILLAIVFGAANAYLGLLVGMTVSASIPAAVISMGIIRVILRKDSILENNMVQTIGCLLYTSNVYKRQSFIHSTVSSADSCVPSRSSSGEFLSIFTFPTIVTRPLLSR